MTTCYIVEDIPYASALGGEVGIDRPFETIDECRKFLEMFGQGWWTYKDQHESVQHVWGDVTPENMPLGAWRFAALLKWLDIGKRPLWFPEAWGTPRSIHFLINSVIDYYKVDVYTASPYVINFYPVYAVKIIRNGQVHNPPSGLEGWAEKFPTGDLWTMGNLTYGLE